jgi:hypothetical protein
VSATPAAGQTVLAWKFVKGDSFAVEQRVSQATALEIKNKPFRQKSTLTLRSRWHVKEVDKDAATLTVAVESMASAVSTGDKAAAASKDDELWRGCEFTLLVDPQGQVRELKGHDTLLKKLAGEDGQRLKLLTALKPPESTQTLLQDVLGPLPAKPATPGDRWQHSATESMSVFGSFVHATEFIYRGDERIETLIKTAYKAPRYAIENDVFRITKGEVKAGDGKGEVAFDGARGRMRRVHKSINVRGELTLETLTGLERVAFTSATDVRIEVK